MTDISAVTIKRHKLTPEEVGDVIVANRTPLIVLGLILMLTGIGAIAFPLAGSLAIDVIVAAVFTVSGLAFLFHAFSARSWGGFAWEIVLSVIYLGAGIFLFVKPVDGVAVLTAVIAISLIADGIVRTILSIAMRQGPWGWLLASGILSVGLGFAVFALPASQAVLLIGVLVGINLFASGSVFMMLASNADAIRDAAKRTAHETTERA